MRILILTAATGQGHVTAARALAEAFAAARPDVTAAVLDAGTHPAIRAAAASYNFFLRRSPAWMSLYYQAVHALRVPRLGAALLRRWSDEVYRSEGPELVVSVHPMLNVGIADTLSRHGAVPFAVVLTDPFPPFWNGWAEPRADLTIVPTRAAAEQLVAWGVPRERVEVAGMPVAPAFRRRLDREPREALLRQHGLARDRFTLLINAGSAGRPTALRLFQKLMDSRHLHPRIQVLFVAGDNSALAARAARLKPLFPAVVFGWSENMADLLDLADAVFTKPGGLAVFEALAKGVPVLVDACAGIMPQERGAAEWLERENLGWRIRRPMAAVAILTDTSPAEWAARSKRCREAASSDAGTIAMRLLSLAGARCDAARRDLTAV